MHQGSNLTLTSQTGVVVIGRNEGARVLRCLAQIDTDCAVVYVDSGSVDGSPMAVRALGIHVLELDPSKPFSAARGRNEGWRYLSDLYKSNLHFVQFVDGDCELVDGWLAKARDCLQHNPSVAGVTGRLREKHPEVSIYNRLCDAEWDRPTGDIDAFGGIVMLRTDALQEVDGYNAELVAGEEPELSHRLRAAGYRLCRLPIEMASHDAAMTRFGQWLTRSIRNGFASASLVAIDKSSSDDRRIWRRRLLSAWLWAWVLPVSILTAALLQPWALMAVLIYVIQIARMAAAWHGEPAIAWPRAFFLMLAKWPECWGQVTYWMGSRARAFDYKESASSTQNASGKK